jgi:hypothetical protein
MELNCSNVIQVPQECKETTAELVVPNFDFVVIATGNNQRLMEVKVHTTDRSIVFFEPINDCSYTIVPSILRKSSKRGAPW